MDSVYLCLCPHGIQLRRGGLWAKHMGLKRGAIGNTLGEHIGNLGNMFGTWWEPIGNLKGTCWEQRKNGKKNPPPLPPHPCHYFTMSMLQYCHIQHCCVTNSTLGSLPKISSGCTISFVKHFFWFAQFLKLNPFPAQLSAPKKDCPHKFTVVPWAISTHVRRIIN